MKDKQTFSKPPYLLIKIGRKEHIENLFYRGEIFMNTISYYRNCENSQVGDDLEGPAYHLGPCQVHFEFNNDAKIPVNILGLKARMEQNLNLYCLFGLTQNDLNWTKENQIISFETLNGFGDYACIITDTQKFIDRVGEKLNMKGFDIWECRGVKYFRETHMGEVTPFMKRDIYKHQKEIRFAVENVKNEPLKIEIDSIEDISTMVPFDINGEIRVSFRKTKH